MIPLPQKPKIIKRESNSATFEIEGLFPGYGMTIGNALRRVLFSSLEGAAITTVKIKGVSHEFSTIPGVLEDVAEICLNLKQVRFKLRGEEMQKAAISVKGEKEIKASDIKTPAQLEVINRDVYIAAITNRKTELELELQVERGLGYVPAEQRKKEKAEIGTINLDAAFTPIRKVNFEVENMRVGDKTDFNRLRILIETDGSIAPEEALVRASGILVEHFKFCTPEIEKIESKKTEENKEEKSTEQKLEIQIEELKLSARVINALAGGGVKTLGGLARKSEKDLLGMEGFGEKGLKEAKKALKKYGLSLRV